MAFHGNSAAQFRIIQYLPACISKFAVWQSNKILITTYWISMHHGIMGVDNILGFIVWHSTCHTCHHGSKLWPFMIMPTFLPKGDEFRVVIEI
ncbi:MAG: hypothetical protein C4567_12300 [Deltaproteobacteria bacterium]|nr:MAG: hypothetical protein C4567_12300 [Deltaproteobacteria bacterium]